MTYALLLLGVLAGQKAPEQVVFCGPVGDKQHLFVINLDGSGFKQITNSPGNDREPAWSPDGSLIVFTRGLPQKKGASRQGASLYSVRRDGRGLTRLTSGPYYDSFRYWSADGKKLTFYRQDKSMSSYELDLASKKIQKKASEDEWWGSFAPDRKRVATVRGGAVSELAGANDIWLSTSPSAKGKKLAHIKGSVGIPQWSPDGRYLAFSVEEGNGYKLYVMSIADKKTRLVAGGDNRYIEDPSWSPDGKRLSYLESSRDEEPMTNASFRQLYTIAPDGTGKKRLTNHWCDDYSPQWTRDGKYIVIQGGRGMERVSGGVMGSSTSHLVVVDASGKGERILDTRGVAVHDVVLRPTGK
jgi:TolB protein